MKVSKDALRTARQLLGATVTGGKIDEEVAKKIVKKVSESKPRNYVSILVAYHRLLRLETDRRKAAIESAAPLSDEFSKEVTDKLKKTYGDDLATDFSVNPNLIGGMRVKVGSNVWDGSVKARIKALENTL